MILRFLFIQSILKGIFNITRALEFYLTLYCSITYKKNDCTLIFNLISIYNINSNDRFLLYLFSLFTSEFTKSEKNF